MLQDRLLQKSKSQRVMIQFTVTALETKRQLTKTAEILVETVAAERLAETVAAEILAETVAAEILAETEIKEGQDNLLFFAAFWRLSSLSTLWKPHRHEITADDKV
jgi:hypothetical protein